MARHAAGLLVLLASVLAACTGTVPSGSSTPSSASIPIGPTATPTSPASVPLTVAEFVATSQTPGDASDVAIRGWLGPLPAMGWEAPYIEPAWIAYPPNHRNAALWQRGPGGDAMCGGAPDCAFLILHVAPQSGVDLGEVARWVDVVGHRNDPASQTCHYVFGEPWPGPTPANAAAVEDCLAQFVVTGLRDASAP